LNGHSSRPPLSVRKRLRTQTWKKYYNEYAEKQYAEKQHDEKLSCASASVWES